MSKMWYGESKVILKTFWAFHK